MSSWVSDTSPLIFLAHLGRLDLLKAEAREISIPRLEIAQKRDPASRAVEAAYEDWVRVRDVTNTDAAEALRRSIHEGEAEAIVLAEELGARWLVMDDSSARRVAAGRGLRLIGTLGILVAAKKRGTLPSVRKEIARLLELGFRVTLRLVAAVLEEVDET